MTELSYWERTNREARERNMTPQEYRMWSRDLEKAQRGREIERQRLYDQQCVDLFNEWRLHSPEKLSVNYKKEA